MHLHRGFALGVIACVGLAARSTHAGETATARAIRLVDHAPGRKTSTIIDGTRKQIFDAGIIDVIIPLPDALPPQPILTFSAGVRPGDGPATLRFVVVLQSADGVQQLLYSRDISEPGWWSGRIDLADQETRGASLVFRRRLLEGTRVRLYQSGWGNPVVASATAAPAPSVILISLDTLRADRVGLYGYAVAHTPTLDALGRAGAWYRDAYSPSEWTLPSHASLFYGRHLAGVPIEPPGADPARPDRPLSLSEVLSAAGYLTAAFTGGGFLAENFGFSRGFGTYFAFDQPKLAPGSCPPERFDGAEVFRRATTWLNERGRSPFFLFLHTYDVHDRCPFLIQGADGVAMWSPSAKLHSERMLAFYDGLISATDQLVGALVAELDRLGLAETTLIIVTSDHGEFFSEHGLSGHGCTLKPYEEVVRVPLILRYPGAISPRGEIDQPVSLLDVAPTILSLLRVPIPSSMRGTVLPGLGLDAQRRPQPVSAVCDDHLMVREGRTKLLMSRGGTQPDEVYDIVDDPKETKNLAGDPSVAAPLREYAAVIADALPPLAARQAEASRPLDESTKERLRALGYQ